MMEKYEIIFSSGWHGQEHDGHHPFRWMKREACLQLHLPPRAGKKFLRIVAGHSFAPQEPWLKVFIEDKEAGSRPILPAFSSYLFPVDGSGDLSCRLVLDRVFRAPGDDRDLGIMVRSVDVFWIEDLEEPLYGEGWYEWEEGELFPFRWMRAEARLILPPSWKGHFLMMPISSEYFNQSQILTIFAGEKILAEWPLLYQWNPYSVELPGKGKENGPEAINNSLEISFRLNKLFPPRYHPDDNRELGIRVGPLSRHDDRERHQDVVFFHQNSVKNYWEMMAGRTVLSSYPVNLGIDLYARCNVSPPCVYCLYDRMKLLEGEDRDIVVDDRTLATYGPFFTAARSVVNCSFGEPLLHPRLQEILEYCASRGKILEISTNGQAFTERTIRALLGKPIYLYVSLDAATPETYARLRNDRFEEIVANLIHLNEERKKAGNLPRIYMVFMPMRVNLHELEEYFRICRRIDADALVLRPLLYLEKPEIRVERGGYLFDYEKELLNREEIAAVVKQAEELAQLYGIPVANQFEFGQIPEPGKNPVSVQG